VLSQQRIAHASPGKISYEAGPTQTLDDTVCLERVGTAEVWK
jgi:hypothetical protein